MQWPFTLDLKFCLLNAENLFLLWDQSPPPDFAQLNEAQWQKLSSSVYENKALRKTQELAKAVQDINADIIMLCEVGGEESLKNFNRYFLNNEYFFGLIEGNSDRNIDVGFLIRKTLPCYFDLRSNKSRPINFIYPHEVGGNVLSHKFSRDVVELCLFHQHKEKPFLILLLTHLKSRLDRDRVDPNGFERRAAEMRTLIEIYGEINARHPGVPIMVSGDLNGNASAHQTDEEFKVLYTQTDLQDVLEVMKLPAEDRATFYQVRNNNRADGRQIDFAFLSQDLQHHLKAQSAYVYRYKDHLGAAHEVPTSLDAKLLLPSDHYPVVFELEKIPLQPGQASKSPVDAK